MPKLSTDVHVLAELKCPPEPPSAASALFLPVIGVPSFLVHKHTNRLALYGNRRCASRSRPRSIDNAARARLEELRREADVRARSQVLRERDWDMAARIRERALSDAREHVNILMQELVLNRSELRSRDTRIADLEGQVEEHRRQLEAVITRAIFKNRVASTKKPRASARAKPEPGIALRKERPLTQRKQRGS